MKICKRCHQLKEMVYNERHCRECRNEKKRMDTFDKNAKECPICKIRHQRVAKECCEKCKILNRHEKINDCWEWTGKIRNNGYGEYTHIVNGNKKYILAHRGSYEVFKGKIQDGLYVCHSCDNKKCVNPDHLWVGTGKDNMQDCLKKGRLKKTTGYKHTEETKAKFKLRSRPQKKGEASWLSKLNEEKVLEIRELLEQNIKTKDIAEKYGISASQVNNIRNRTSWGHI